MKLVEFTAPNRCSPCLVLRPILERFLKAHPEVDFEEIDIDREENGGRVEEYRVKSIPLLLFLDQKGRELRRVRGLVPLAAVERAFAIATNAMAEGRWVDRPARRRGCP